MAADGSWSAAKMSLEPYRIHEVADDALAALDYCYEQGGPMACRWSRR